MKKVITVNEEVITVETVTLSSLKKEIKSLALTAVKMSAGGGALLRHTLQARLSNDDLKLFGEAVKESFSVGYAKQVLGAVNIGYNLKIIDDSDKMAILALKGFDGCYQQLRDWKKGISADTVTAPTVGKTSQSRSTVPTAHKTDVVTNHLAVAVDVSATITDCNEILDSIKGMLKGLKNQEQINALSVALLAIEDELYTITSQEVA